MYMYLHCTVLVDCPRVFLFFYKFLFQLLLIACGIDTSSVLMNVHIGYTCTCTCTCIYLIVHVQYEKHSFYYHILVQSTIEGIDTTSFDMFH